MNKFIAFCAAVISFFITFAILAGLMAAFLVSAGNGSLGIPSGLAITIGLGFEVAKWIVSLVVGIKIFKLVNKKIQKTNTEADTK